MTDKELMRKVSKQAFAIGYLRGLSALLWNLDHDTNPVSFSAEEAAYYDGQVDVLAHALMGKEDDNGLPD